jgi:hypothetical protein
MVNHVMGAETKALSSHSTNGLSYARKQSTDNLLCHGSMYIHKQSNLN